ncbi:ComF family protein [Volucribacter psittacicida]|uniref:ComF family protein n=1 Tax=Volucribacter psittacicida TaxID=203482 RepID=A0A4R1FQK6_9PAST|nr:amidophosphoribosyltransferase [Volucribacter psittacicida]TCJ95814.1 ComF family protein [Volucribacter psittacicida]
MNIWGFRCIQCQRLLHIGHHGICSHCYKSIPYTAYCSGCGHHLVENSHFCGHCLKLDFAWDHLVVVSRYQKPLAQYIHQFKFRGKFWLDRTLARLLLLAIWQARRTHGLILPDLIMPVPLHHWRQWWRGYNQADLLGRLLAKYLNIPYSNRWIKRHKRTISQRGLNASARRQNMQNAFQLDPRFQPKHCQSVALVDDVITTGATLNAIIDLLRKQGITHIQVWGLCKT